MAKRMKVKTYPIYSNDMHKCMQWCLQNRIKIHVEPEIDFSIKPAKTGKYRIIINDTNWIWHYCIHKITIISNML